MELYPFKKKKKGASEKNCMLVIEFTEEQRAKGPLKSLGAAVPSSRVPAVDI